jgi:hypothetical protein
MAAGRRLMKPYAARELSVASRHSPTSSRHLAAQPLQLLLHHTPAGLTLPTKKIHQNALALERPIPQLHRALGPRALRHLGYFHSPLTIRTTVLTAPQPSTPAPSKPSTKAATALSSAFQPSSTQVSTSGSKSSTRTLSASKPTEPQSPHSSPNAAEPSSSLAPVRETSFVGLTRPKSRVLLGWNPIHISSLKSRLKSRRIISTRFMILLSRRAMTSPLWNERASFLGALTRCSRYRCCALFRIQKQR